MSSKPENFEYIRVTEFEPGCYQFKINYKEVENIVQYYSPSLSREICSGRNHWLLRYSNTSFSWPYTHMDFVSLQVCVITMHDLNKRFELSLLDKAGKPVMTASQEASAYTIIPLIVMKHILEEVAVNDGWFFMECKIYGSKTSSQKVSLPDQLGNLLESRQMTDITIQVKGELFHAHRLILGARSAVFRAQFFGPMVEAQVGCIKIDDMEAEVFRYVLHYIYTDTLDDDPESISTNLAQHLLVAADRYVIEGLREKCEGMLCKDVSLYSVLSSLALAEQHNCSNLKNACIKFATEPTNLIKLVFTKKYYQFTQDFPDLVALLQKHAEQL